MQAVRVVFMRVLPDGQLDTTDTYSSDWIGEVTGWCRPGNCTPTPTPNRTCKFPSIRLSRWFYARDSLAVLRSWQRRHKVWMLSKSFAIAMLAKQLTGLMWSACEVLEVTTTAQPRQ